MITLSELEGASRLSVAALIGLAVGLERQWSGHASGPDARFAGLRTFLLLGILGGAGGLLASLGHEAVAAVAVAAGMSAAVAAYVVATHRDGRDLDGTTEVAAVVVVGLACLAGVGWLVVASGAAAIVVLALSEKQRLHHLVQAIGRHELSAALQFAVLAVVVLPVLPEGPYLGPLAVRPRALWIVVLAFCALNFASYAATRAAGSRRGYGIAGALGGLLSSTAVTLAYARRSRTQPDDDMALARAVVAACAVLIPRIFVISTALNPMVALAALPYLLPPLVVGIAFVFIGTTPASADATPPAVDRSPLRLMNALQMAVAFQMALSIIAMLRPRLGELGIYGAAVALGLTDMDALNVSVSSPANRIEPAIAGRALAIGMLANTLFKLTLAVTIGSPGFRRRAALGLAALAVIGTAALLIL